MLALQLRVAVVVASDNATYCAYVRKAEMSEITRSSAFVQSPWRNTLVKDEEARDSFQIFSNNRCVIAEQIIDHVVTPSFSSLYYCLFLDLELA